MERVTRTSFSCFEKDRKLLGLESRKKQDGQHVICTYSIFSASAAEKEKETETIGNASILTAVYIDLLSMLGSNEAAIECES